MGRWNFIFLWLSVELCDGPRGARGPLAARLETAATHSYNLPETAVDSHLRFGFSSTLRVWGVPANVPLNGLLARAGFS